MTCEKCGTDHDGYPGADDVMKELMADAIRGYLVQEGVRADRLDEATDNIVAIVNEHSPESDNTVPLPDEALEAMGWD